MAGQSGYDEIADQLYGLPLKEFTSARTAAVARAKQDGDPELAQRIGALRKPTLVGWLANQLVREHPDEIADMMALGETLRDAMRRLDGDELRESAGRQQQIVYALVRQARSLAEAAGQEVSETTKRSLEETLHAALAEQQAGAELSAGRLTGPLARNGFPDLGAVDAPSSTSPSSPSARTQRKSAPSRRTDDDDRRREAEARTEAERTAEASAQAQQVAEEAERSAGAARKDTERLRDELDEALEELAKKEADLRRARRDAREADRAARQAAHRLDGLLERRHPSTG